MTKFYTLLLLVISAGFFSCKSAGKAYNKGDYQQSIDLSIRKLQKDPSDGETKALLMAAYKNVTAVSESRIRSLSTGTDISYENIYYEYLKLQAVYQKLEPFPSLVTLVHAVDYTGFINTYREKAAEDHFHKGMEQMHRENKIAYQAAYHEFKSALQFADKNETREKMEEAFKAAVVNVAILPVKNQFNPYIYNISYQLQHFQDDLLHDLRLSNSEFLNVYTDVDARSRNIEPDQVIDLRMGQFDIGRPYDKSQTRNVSKDVVIKEIVYKPDSVVKEYGKVTAQITSTQRTLASEGVVYVTVSDKKGNVLWTDQVKGVHQWKTSFASYHGDERALTDADRTLINQSTDSTMPREDEISEKILGRIRTDLQTRLKSFFARSN
jgi:hypothetical protein